MLCLGDIVGAPGRSALKTALPVLKKDLQADFVIANGENASGGAGLDPKSAEEILSFGVDLITLGDHTWQRASIKEYLDKNRENCIRPANYPGEVPGRGWAIKEAAGVKIAVFNLLGRIFMGGPLDCPFSCADKLLNTALSDCRIRILDMHAEATSEKIAMSRFLDGRVSLIFGTHTHVQTADEELFSSGTAYISDLGMCGPTQGVLGMKSTVSIKRFTNGMRYSYEVESGPSALQGIFCDFKAQTGHASYIERIRIPLLTE